MRERLAAEPDEAEALLELARHVGADRTRKVEAVELWERYAKAVDEADLGDALLGLARAQVEARSDEAAIATLERCIASPQPPAPAFELLGHLLGRHGRLQEAVEALRRATDLQPRDVGPRIALVTCLDALGRESEASRVLAEIAEIGGDDPAVQALIRELMHRRG